MERVILHLDFDSFFASCEQQANPLYQGKPLGVTAHNGRNCIIASSREAKKLGIQTASRAHEARKLCPSLILVPAHFTRYLEISKKFLRVCQYYSPFIEVFSIDELFMDVTATARLFGGVYPLIYRLKKQLAQEVGEVLTVSVGVSYNKLLAKMASGLEKPNGITQITPQNLDVLYKNSKLTSICGIGERIKFRLNTLGVYTLLDLRGLAFHKLLSEFGPAQAHFLRDVAYGIDTSCLNLYTQKPTVKSVGRQYCLPENEYNTRRILQNVYELYEELAIKLRRLEKKARTVWLGLYGSYTIAGQSTYTTYFDTSKEMFEAALRLIQKQQPEFETGYTRRIMVGVTQLADTAQNLFTYKNRLEAVWQAVDHINDRYGDHTIRNGFLLYADKLTTVPNGWLGDRYERTKLTEVGI